MRHVERLHALAEKIRMELARRQWSEQKLASEVGMSARTLNDRLNGYSDWKLHELIDMAEVLWEGDLAIVLGADVLRDAPPRESATLAELAAQITAAAAALSPLASPGSVDRAPHRRHSR